MDTRQDTNWGYWVVAGIGLVLVVLAFFWWRGDLGGETPAAEAPATAPPAPADAETPGTEEPAGSEGD